MTKVKGEVSIVDKENLDREAEQKKEQEEELFFDGERYYTREEFFNPDDEEETSQFEKKSYRTLKIIIAFFICIALISNVLSLWSQLINIPSFEFLTISKELSENEDVERYKESVVVVRTENSKGTGFYFSDEGFVMTNYHVIDDGLQITVTFKEGDTYRGEVVVTDEDIDIAIIQIDTEKQYPTLSFTNNWEEGMSVYVIGNPLFFNHIANKGNITGEITVKNKEKPMLILDAPIYRGNSGSPIINEAGQVIGVVYATTKIDDNGNSKNVGLVIPVPYFERYLEDLAK